MGMFDDVGKFHQKFGLPFYGDGFGPPALLTEEEYEFRKNFLREELREFELNHENGNLPEALDGLEDLAWVALGTAHCMRAPFDAVWAEVRRANMAKIKSKGDTDPLSVRKSRFDIVKPPGWKPPDVAGAILKDSLSKSGWDKKYYDLAQFVAQWSKDPRTKVGAVVVGLHRGDVAHGFNGFPPGIEDSPERLQDRPTKHRLVQHAERNALDNASFDVRGGTLYATQFPCSECAKSVVMKGIARVVCPPCPDYEPWINDAPWTKLLFSEGGVHLEEIE